MRPLLHAIQKCPELGQLCRQRGGGKKINREEVEGREEGKEGGGAGGREGGQSGRLSELRVEHNRAGARSPEALSETLNPKP